MKLSQEFLLILKFLDRGINSYKAKNFITITQYFSNLIFEMKQMIEVGACAFLTNYVLRAISIDNHIKSGQVGWEYFQPNCDIVDDWKSSTLAHIWKKWYSL